MYDLASCWVRGTGCVGPFTRLLMHLYPKVVPGDCHVVLCPTHNDTVFVLHSADYYADSLITDVILSERQRVEESVPRNAATAHQTEIGLPIPLRQ